MDTRNRQYLSRDSGNLDRPGDLGYRGSRDNGGVLRVKQDGQDANTGDHINNDRSNFD